jgi:hypothetical protein
MRFPASSYNTPIQSSSSCPIIGLAALLNLVAVSEKLQHKSRTEKGKLCPPNVSPPAYRRQPRVDPALDQAPRCQSSSADLAAQPDARASVNNHTTGAGE